MLDRQVLAHQIELVVEAHFARAMPPQRAPQQLAQLLHHPHGAGGVAVARPHGNRVQRVEEEVRVDLRFERRKAGTCELLREPRQLHFAVARFLEEADRMRDPRDEEVDDDAEWERREDPAHPVARREAMLERAGIHQVADGQLQQLAADRPRDAEQHRHTQVQRDARADVRSFDRPPARHGEDRRREDGVDEPVAAAEEQLVQRRHRLPGQPPLGDVVDRGEQRRRQPHRGGEDRDGNPPAARHADTLCHDPRRCAGRRPFASSPAPFASLPLSKATGRDDSHARGGCQ